MNAYDFSKRLNNDSNFKQQVLNKVNENTSYYVENWKKSNNPFKFSGWNWATFLFTPFWLSYRHMYGAVLIYFLLLFVAISVSMLFPLLIYYTPITEVGYFLWITLAPFFLSVFFGLKGNAFYAKYIVRLLEKEKEENSTNVPLFYRTGRSWISAIVAPVFLFVFLSIPLFWIDSYVKTSTLPYGTYVFLEDVGPPQSVLDALYRNQAIFEKYSSTIHLLYYAAEPVSNRPFQIVVHYQEEGSGEWIELRERTFTFFSSNSIEIDILDAEDPLTQVGNYRVDIFIGEELVDYKLFELTL
ncbi:hypothetical protein J2S74_003499 [Evansella vedderi]|uniref:DUF2628 domain-containing protein n=1 Tax=Evansella vedderi TaxID=38282 RepID=A0ABT9ZYQ5_9BACI|nr:DUF2628 domain-containing protein [Evansella vedderi]MDQ0256100.1 hypothetical protein [Evansella vedderi]